EASRLRVAKRVFGERGRSGPAERRVRVREGGVGDEQRGEESTGNTRGIARIAAERRLLDPSSAGHDVPVGHPRLTVGVELSRVQPVEQLAEEIGIVVPDT